MSEKKEKVQRQRYGLTCTLKSDERTNERVNSVIVVTVGKNLLKIKLEFNYFVIIILILFAFQRVFFV